MWKWLIGALAAASIFFWWSNADSGFEPRQDAKWGKFGNAYTYKVQRTQGQKCAPIDQIIKMLTGYDEIPIANMTDRRGNHMQLWGNLDTGSWTLFYTPKNRGSEADTVACYLDEGMNLNIGGRPRQ